MLISPAAVLAATGEQPKSNATQVLGQTDQSQRGPAQGAEAPADSGKNVGPSGSDSSTQAERDKKSMEQYDDILRQLLPLDKEQIQIYRERSNERERALQPASPSLGTRTVRVFLEPGRAPETVRCTANIVTSLVFHDSSGQPWPITSVTNGGPALFQILRPELPEGNLLNVIPQREYGASSIVVTLAKRDIPLVIRLESDGIRASARKADGMVLFQINHSGPNARAPMIQNVKETANSAMLAFLDHAPPKEAVRVGFEPKDESLQIWRFNKTNYIRTTHTLMWPAWLSVVNGAGDMKCYEAPPTPRILVSREGSIQTITLKDREQR